MLLKASGGKKEDHNSIKLGPGAGLGGKRLFPDDNPWNQDISREPVDPNSDTLIASIGRDRPLHPDFGTVYQGAPGGIPYVVVDLGSNKLRPAGWTSADAAGLPILPGLVRYDEAVEQKAIKHALRFTVVKSRRAYVRPATHFASPHKDANLPPMGMRVRLKGD